MIVPDDKDWTWVLRRPCPECGFDASTCPAERVASLTRENADTWRGLLEAAKIRAGRPNDATWSSLEYACHVRDVFRRYDQRIALMQDQDDPLFPNWDQDASAVDDRYDDQVAANVVDELGSAAHALAARLDAITGEEWYRPGRRSDGASFTIETIARYMIHDPIHHVWDVSPRRPLPPSAAVVGFIDCINRGDLRGLGALMTDDHRLVVLDEPPLVGRSANLDAWNGYFSAFPDYVIHPRHIATDGAQVAVLGTTTGSHLGLPDEDEMQLDVIWLAQSSDGRLSLWQIAADSPVLRAQTGIPSSA